MSEVPPSDPSTEFSPYPRQQPGTIDARPPKISLDCISEAIALVKQDLGLWVVAALLSGVISYAVSIAVSLLANIVAYGSAISTQTSVMGVILAVVFGFVSSAVSYLLYAGMVQMALGKMDGRPLEISDLFSGFGRFPQMLIGVTVTSLAMYLGLVLLIIPGLFVAGALAFVPFLVVRQNLSGMEAVKKSWEVLKPQAFSMFGFMIVLGLLIMVGLILCGVGVLFTLPVGAAAMAIQYRAFFPETTAVQSHAIGMEPPKAQW